MPLPPFTSAGELPPGVHRATLREVLTRFGAGSRQRMAVAERLERVYRLAQATGHLSRFVVFGSFVTDKPEPHDVDVFLVMDDAFDAGTLPGETALAFDHAAGRRALWCQRVLGASSGRFRRRASRGRILAGEAGGWPPGHCRYH